MYLFIAAVFYKESEVPPQATLHAQTFHNIHSPWNTQLSGYTLFSPISILIYE